MVLEGPKTKQLDNLTLTFVVLNLRAQLKIKWSIGGVGKPQLNRSTLVGLPVRGRHGLRHDLLAQRQVSENLVNLKNYNLNSKCNSNYKKNYKRVHANYN